MSRLVRSDQSTRSHRRDHSEITEAAPSALERARVNARYAMYVSGDCGDCAGSIKRNGLVVFAQRAASRVKAQPAQTDVPTEVIYDFVGARAIRH